MKRIFKLTGIVVFLITGGCKTDTPLVSLGIDNQYIIPRMSKLSLKPALSGDKYIWRVNGEIVSTDQNYIFLSEKEGEYELSFTIDDVSTPFYHEFVVKVVHEEVEYSPYISKVYEYCPAPGQFINEMPRYDEGDTYEDMLKKAEECISGKNDVMISLGAYGGYVTFGFDHTVINHEGEKDFRIWGNCFYELTDPEKRGGSAEPGIVMVSYDINGNGLPDDEWYELAGSEYRNPVTRHNYSITYHRPSSEHIALPDDSGMLTDTEYIRWEDSEGKVGYVARNSFHSQDYYPKWVSDDVLLFEGSCLPSNGVDISGNGSYYVLYSYDWGYADNHPNEYPDLNGFDISDAVDNNGNKVKLPGVDFIRVYTGVNQYCGWIGETSTEICRAQDLHIDLE